MEMWFGGLVVWLFCCLAYSQSTRQLNNMTTKQYVNI